MDKLTCKPTLANWSIGHPDDGIDYCWKVAWKSDNPDYDLNATPAPPLNKVQDEVGNCD